MKPANENPRNHVEEPAKITQLHVRNRSFVIEIPDGKKTKTIIAPIKGWRKLTPLQRAHAMGQLAGGSPKYIAQDRFEAGEKYADLFALSESSGRDSTDLDRINSSGGGSGLSDAQSKAMTKRTAVESHLGARDRQIVRLVCGEGEWPSAAVAAACGKDYAKASVPRFRESLDALIEAFESARRDPGRVNMRVVE